MLMSMKPEWWEFLSTPSARRATLLFWSSRISKAISIHALREEGDLRWCRSRRTDPISIHALREEGDKTGNDELDEKLISIHALREEGDAVTNVNRTHVKDFYPRPPRGGRQQKQRQNLYFQTNYTTFCTNLEEP